MLAPPPRSGYHLAFDRPRSWRWRFRLLRVALMIVALLGVAIALPACGASGSSKPAEVTPARSSTSALLTRTRAASALGHSSTCANANAQAPGTSPATPGAALPTTDPFYKWVRPLPHAAPGTILRTRTIAFVDGSAHPSLKTTQLLYVTTDELGCRTISVVTVFQPHSGSTGNPDPTVLLSDVLRRSRLPMRPELHPQGGYRGRNRLYHEPRQYGLHGDHGGLRGRGRRLRSWPAQRIRNARCRPGRRAPARCPRGLDSSRNAGLFRWRRRHGVRLRTGPDLRPPPRHRRRGRRRHPRRPVPRPGATSTTPSSTVGPGRSPPTWTASPGASASATSYRLLSPPEGIAVASADQTQCAGTFTWPHHRPASSSRSYRDLAKASQSSSASSTKPS